MARTRKVLVVDDEPDLRLLVELQLTPEYDVDAVATGEEALEAVGRERYDAILLDLRLPGIDGWEVLDRLQHRPETRDLPVIVISAHGSDRAEARARQSGCAAFLAKPFSVTVLRQTVHDVQPPAA